MKLKFSKWFIEKVDVQFINFLGYRIKSTHKLIRKDSVTRAKRKIKTKIRNRETDEYVSLPLQIL
jgi:hypothetical protein